MAVVIGLALAGVSGVSQAQVRDGQYQGMFETSEKVADNRAQFTVAGGAVIGYLILVIEANPGCLSIVADLRNFPLRISGQSAGGSVPIIQQRATTPCSSTRAFDGTDRGDADLSVTANGDALVGTLTIRPLGVASTTVAYRFRALRLGAGAGPTTTAKVSVPGIEEWLTGAPLTNETKASLLALENCKPEDYAVQSNGKAGRCQWHLEAEKARGGILTDALDYFHVAGMTGPDGKLLVPSLNRMWPVLMKLAKLPNGRENASRLLGLIVAMDLEARAK